MMADPGRYDASTDSYKHRITNSGVRTIRVHTPLGEWIDIRPGESRECYVGAIYHGGGSARYSVEPVE
jgi:hypothetical protein